MEDILKLTLGFNYQYCVSCFVPVCLFKLIAISPRFSDLFCFCQRIKRLTSNIFVGMHPGRCIFKS